MSSNTRGFITPIKAVATNAMQQVFSDSSFPDPDFRGINISIEYPVEKAKYPAIWVDFIPGEKVGDVGVGHFELTDSDPDTGSRTKYYRWQGNGTISYTIAALSSLQRDRLHDEIITILAFSDETALKNIYTRHIQSSELVALQPIWKAVQTGGFAATPGTPWETMEVIYEATVSLYCLFEFTSDSTGSLVPLSAIQVDGFPAPSLNPHQDDGYGRWL